MRIWNSLGRLCSLIDQISHHRVSPKRLTTHLARFPRATSGIPWPTRALSVIPWPNRKYFHFRHRFRSCPRTRKMPHKRVLQLRLLPSDRQICSSSDPLLRRFNPLTKKVLPLLLRNSTTGHRRCIILFHLIWQSRRQCFKWWWFYSLEFYTFYAWFSRLFEDHHLIIWWTLYIVDNEFGCFGGRNYLLQLAPQFVVLLISL